MDKKKAMLNIGVSVGSKIANLILVILVKRFLIDYCGNEVNGLNALYISIIGFLSVAELGVGSAISFCMYKPIVEGDNNKVAALYHLLNRLYLIVGAILFAGGLAITPFIKYFAKDYKVVDENLYLTFVLMLISVVVTYVFSAKTSLINAYKNNYITTAIYSGGLIFQYILQIVVLILTKSYAIYLVCRTIAALAQWLVTDIIAKKQHGGIISNPQKIDSQTKALVTKNIKAMFMHKIGTVLVNTVDSVVISIFIGVVVLGKYSNYVTIMTSLSSVIGLVFSSITSVVGHLCVEEDKLTVKRYFEKFQYLNFALGFVFYLGYFAVIDNVISILFSGDLVLERSVTFVIALDGFVKFMRNNIIMFKDATGTFYNDRWRPFFEGIANLVLSVLLVNFIGVSGVIIATILTNLFICNTIEPYVLYKHALGMSPKGFYFVHYARTVVFTGGLLLMGVIMQKFSSQWATLFVNGGISVILSAVLCLMMLVIDRNLAKEIFGSIKNFKNKRAVVGDKNERTD